MGILSYAESISLFEKAIVTFFVLKPLFLLFFPPSLRCGRAGLKKKVTPPD